MITSHPWFVREGKAWSWAPASWEGRVLCAAVLILVGVSVLYYGRSAKTLYIVGTSMAVLVLLVWLTAAPG